MSKEEVVQISSTHDYPSDRQIEGWHMTEKEFVKWQKDNNFDINDQCLGVNVFIKNWDNKEFWKNPSKFAD
jgi:hypothetical protein